MNSMLSLGRNWETTIATEALNNVECIRALPMNNEQTRWSVFLDYKEIDGDGKITRRCISSQILPDRKSARKCRLALASLLRRHRIITASRPSRPSGWAVGAMEKLT